MTPPGSAESPPAPGPVGRTVRGLVGLAFLGWVVRPASSRPPVAGLVAVAAGLVAVHVLVHVAVVRRFRSLHPVAGAVLAIGPGAVPFVAGGPVGRQGALAFWGVSLLVASRQAVPGCEVMAIPGLLFGEYVHLPCAFLSPLDRLEAESK